MACPSSLVPSTDFKETQKLIKSLCASRLPSLNPAAFAWTPTKKNNQNQHYSLITSPKYLNTSGALIFSHPPIDSNATSDTPSNASQQFLRRNTVSSITATRNSLELPSHQQPTQIIQYVLKNVDQTQPCYRDRIPGSMFNSHIQVVLQENRNKSKAQLSTIETIVDNAPLTKQITGRTTNSNNNNKKNNLKLPARRQGSETNCVSFNSSQNDFSTNSVSHIIQRNKYTANSTTTSEEMLEGIWDLETNDALLFLDSQKSPTEQLSRNHAPVLVQQLLEYPFTDSHVTSLTNNCLGSAATGEHSLIFSNEKAGINVNVNSSFISSSDLKTASGSQQTETTLGTPMLTARDDQRQSEIRESAEGESEDCMQNSTSPSLMKKRNSVQEISMVSLFTPRSRVNDKYCVSQKKEIIKCEGLVVNKFSNSCKTEENYHLNRIKRANDIYESLNHTEKRVIQEVMKQKKKYQSQSQVNITKSIDQKINFKLNSSSSFRLSMNANNSQSVSCIYGIGNEQKSNNLINQKNDSNESQLQILNGFKSQCVSSEEKMGNLNVSKSQTIDTFVSCKGNSLTKWIKRSNIAKQQQQLVESRSARNISSSQQ